MFLGVGSLGWTREYTWSEFRSVREDPGVNPYGWNRGRMIVLDGARRAAFGSMWSEDRRYYVLSAIRTMLRTTDGSQSTQFSGPRFG